MKNRFISAWTDLHRHFNSTSTSRVESAHAAIKHNLTTSIGDLNLVFQRLDESISQQLHEINSNTSRQRSTILTGLNSVTFFSRVNSKISTFALKIAFKEFAKVKLDNITNDKSKKMKPCRNVLFQVMGIPCCHMMKRWLLSPSACLLKSNFSQQWWLSGSSSNMGTEEDSFLGATPKKYPPMPPLTAETAQGEFMTEEDLIEEDLLNQQEWEQQCQEVDEFNEKLRKSQDMQRETKAHNSVKNLFSDTNIALLKQRSVFLLIFLY